MRARVTMLTRGLTNPDLRPDEHEALQRAIRLNSTRALLSEAEAALRRGGPGARRRALAVATGRGFDARTRAKALLAAALPRWAGRRLERQERLEGALAPHAEPRLVTPWVVPHVDGRSRPADTPSFSVIIAAYQAAGTIGEAIESALGQTPPPLEVVVCDDGSTDDIEAAVAPYRRDVVFLRQANGGEAAAKNAAARASTGDFVVILDADDVYLPGRLEALAGLAQARPELDILTTDAYLEVDGVVVQRCYTDTFRFADREQRRAILEQNFIFGHAAVRRERLFAVSGFDEGIRWTADWDCWLRMILTGSQAGLVPEPLSRYRLNSGSLSAQREDHIAGRLLTIGKALERTDLSATERETAHAALRDNERALRIARARAALLEGRGDARRRALEVVVGSGHGARTRAKALATALAPGYARSRLSRAPRETTAGVIYQSDAL